MNQTEMTIQQIAQDRAEITSKILTDLIREHSATRDRMVKLYERYKGSVIGVPVLTRSFADASKINNRLNNDFFKEIVNVKIGYLFGEPISYMLDKTEFTDDNEKLVNENEYYRLNDWIDIFEQRNNLADMDAEAGKLAAICGLAGRLCYIDKDGDERVMNVPGWECIFISDASVNEPQYAIRYYEYKKNNDVVYRVELYDDKKITFYLGTADSGFTYEDETPHLFDEVPLIPILNNEEQQGDCENVLALIDGFDNTISDVNSEIEQFRLAYLACYGVEIDADTLEKARKTGVYNFPDTECKAEFIVKDLNDGIVENHLNRLENNIYRFSQTPNFADEAFAGSQSGEARKFKMLAFENKCSTMERKYHNAMRQMFKVLTTAWKKKGYDIDYMNIDMTFTRNFPLDLLYEAEVQAKLIGLTSDKTRLGLFSVIDNPENEMARMEMERQENGSINLDSEDINDQDDGDAEE